MILMSRELIVELTFDPATGSVMTTGQDEPVMKGRILTLPPILEW